MKRLTSLCVLAAAASLTIAGCATEPVASRPQRLNEIQRAYAQRNYALGYERAVQLHQVSRGTDRDEAAYLAGISAQRLGNAPAAESYLQQAARSSDRELAGDAGASLGLLHSQQGRYDLAARDLLRAAPNLSGQDKANAYFYAAVAQQKLGQWAQARTNLVLARAASSDPGFREQVESQLAVTGYTVQVGAFGNPNNARRAADELAGVAASGSVGSPRLISSTDSAGRPVTLVHVGRFATFSAANRARQMLGQTQSIVVPLSR